MLFWRLRDIREVPRLNLTEETMLWEEYGTVFTFYELTMDE